MCVYAIISTMKKKSSSPLPEKEFYGTTTVGERGQVVIPALARKSLKLSQHDKLLVFGMGEMVVCMKLANLEKLASDMSSKLTEIKSLLKKNK